MIMGKLRLELVYRREKVAIEQGSAQNLTFYSKERYVNRKIPLNGYLNLSIGGITDLKNSIDNIEYLTSLNKEPDLTTSIHDRTLTSLSKRKDKREAVDKQRALTQLYKDGLNLALTVSLFDEDESLKARFGSQESRTVFKTLSPVF